MSLKCEVLTCTNEAIDEKSYCLRHAPKVDLSTQRCTVQGCDELAVVGIAYCLSHKPAPVWQQAAMASSATTQKSPPRKADAELICPHCQVKGRVNTKQVKVKKGISGGKATGAIITGGLSILATGLSRKETQTEANCLNCKSTWRF